MVKKIETGLIIILLVIFAGCNSGPSQPAGPTVNSSPPNGTVKLIFIHHSTGQKWLQTGYGNLGQTLNTNHYYVSDTNYGWDDPLVEPENHSPIGSFTDTPDWPLWFTDNIMPYVYTEYSNSCYTNSITDPGGENEIIMFKSCFPNSEVGDSIDDEKAIYNSLLTYFENHPDKMFVLVVPPPEIVISSAALTRSLANWLCDSQTGWLSSYSGHNVFVFDFYNVLTAPENHHWVNNSRIEHVVASSNNQLYYPSGGDDHPSATGSQKATNEFVPLLNAWYHQWKSN